MTHQVYIHHFDCKEEKGTPDECAIVMKIGLTYIFWWIASDFGR